MYKENRGNAKSHFMLQVQVILGRNGAAISLLFDFVKIMLRVIYSEVRCYFITLNGY